MKSFQSFFTFTFFVLASSFTSTAQKGVTTVGIQYKPIFPVTFVGTGNQHSESGSVRFDIKLKSGFNGGMMVRHGFTDLLAFEAGINYVKRNYSISIHDSDFAGESRFRLIGYEIPLSFLVYIRLGEQIFMNASMGPSLDMFASNVQSHDYYFKHVSFRRSIFQPAITANLGWEWRTEHSGYLYFGASYHRPFEYTYLTKVEYVNRGKDVETDQRLLGNYLTVDFRYFFFEDPLKNKRRSQDE